jgi:hypothetical protein
VKFFHYTFEDLLVYLHNVAEPGELSGIELATGWMNRGSSSGRGWEFFSSPPRLRPTQPPIQWVPEVLSLGVKRQGCEADNPPPSSAEIKNEWSYTYNPQYAFMGWWSVKKISTGTTLPLPFTLPIRWGGEVMFRNLLSAYKVETMKCLLRWSSSYIIHYCISL